MSLERRKAKRGYWTCQRRLEGLPCRSVNSNRKRKCERCGAPKPPKRQPKHMVALELPYETYVELNGGDHCAVCLRPRTTVERRLDRDHCHRTGQPRGLLCTRCNRALVYWMTSAWLRAAADYLDERSEGRVA